MAATISDSDVFRVNTAFSAKLRAVRIPQVLPKDATGARDGAAGGGAGGGLAGAFGGVTDEALMKKIESQRQYLVDATIAKVMKSRAVCSHADLVAAVLKSVGSRYGTDAAAVKLRIEALISRSFMARDAEDPALYRFVP